MSQETLKSRYKIRTLIRKISYFDCFNFIAMPIQKLFNSQFDGKADGYNVVDDMVNQFLCFPAAINNNIDTESVTVILIANTREFKS